MSLLIVRLIVEEDWRFLPSFLSFLPSFLPAVPGGLRHVRPLMFAQPVWRISVWGISSGAEFERWRILVCGMEVEG